MPASFDTRTYDALLTSTLASMGRRLSDNVFNSLVTLAWLRMADKMDMLSGGERIEEPLLYAKNSTAKNYADYDPLDVTPQDGITKAFYPWAQAGVSVSIAGSEMRKNKSTPHKILDLLAAKAAQADLSLQDLVNAQLLGDATNEASENRGVDTAGFEKFFIGIAGLVQTTPTTNHSPGGINQSTAGNEFWRNQTLASTATTWHPGSGNAGLAELSRMYNLCSKGSDHPDLILMDQHTFERYDQMAVSGLRLFDTRFADLGFTNLKYKNATVVYDEHFGQMDTPQLGDSGTGRAYFLNSKYLSWKVHEDANFTPGPFTKPTNGDSRIAQILLMGQLVTSNRRRLGVLHTIDTTA